MIRTDGRSCGRESRSHMCEPSRSLKDPKAWPPKPDIAITLHLLAMQEFNCGTLLTRLYGHLEKENAM